MPVPPESNAMQAIRRSPDCAGVNADSDPLVLLGLVPVTGVPSYPPHPVIPSSAKHGPANDDVAVAVIVVLTAGDDNTSFAASHELELPLVLLRVFHVFDGDDVSAGSPPKEPAPMIATSAVAALKSAAAVVAELLPPADLC